MFKQNTTVDPTPDFRRYIEKIVDSSECERHDAGAGHPCWTMPLDITKDAGRALNWAVCNRRVNNAFTISSN